MNKDEEKLQELEKQLWEDINQLNLTLENHCFKHGEEEMRVYNNIIVCFGCALETYDLIKNREQK